MKKKGKDATKKPEKKIPDQPASPDEAEQKRRSSLTDTPITSSSSEGMASNDLEPSTSATAAGKKKRKGRKKSENEPPAAMPTTTSSSSFQPVYSSANSVSLTSSTWSPPTVSSNTFDQGGSVANCNLNVVLNNHRPPQLFEDNKWLAELRGHLSDGNAEAFFCGIRYLCLILCRGDYAEHGNKSQEELIRFVAENVVVRYYDPHNQITIFMTLSSCAAKRCSELNHGFCRIMRTLLKLISPRMAKEQLAIASKPTGRTALHLAMNTGEICQVRVLMEYDVPVSLWDKRVQTELFYALNSMSLEKVENLLWYGCDFSQTLHMKPNYTPLMHAQVIGQNDILPWLADRTAALEHKFDAFVSLLSRNVLVIKEALSDLHTMRLSPGFDANQPATRLQAAEPTARSHSLNIREIFERVDGSAEMAVLFVVPYCYNDRKNAQTPADLPWIERTGLFVQNYDGTRRPLQLFPMNPLMEASDTGVFELPSVIEPANNGHVWCFRMPEKLRKCGHVLSAHFDTSGLEREAMRTTLLGLRVYRVVPAEVDLKKNN
ncbi:hypothetical protein M3Y99_00280900 [Aphelenchoides fujianensis]|nr:hypothetical protein M3Y99_00280900 [Aphelenchoides fujianensis]